VRSFLSQAEASHWGDVAESCRTHSMLRRQHTSAYVRGRGRELPHTQYASAYVSICQHTLGDSIRQHTSAYLPHTQHASAYVSIRQHTCPTYSMRQNTSAYVSIPAPHTACVSIRQHTCPPHSMRQHTTAYISIPAAHTAYVSICQHTPSYLPHTQDSLGTEQHRRSAVYQREDSS
jgi:hypothetical protein